jgi:hypothetical protein
MEKAYVEKMLQPGPCPVLIKYFDAKAKISNGIVSPGYNGTLTGEELKFDITSAAECIFLYFGG